MTPVSAADPAPGVARPPVFCLLDLRPAPDSHPSALPLSVAAGALAAAGYAVRQVRAVVPPGAAEAAAERVAAWLAGLGAPAIVVVERLWPAALLVHLRRVGARVCVWWLRQDVREDPGAAVDVTFGLDLDGLPRAAALVAALAAGSAPPGAAEPAPPGLGRRAPEGWRSSPGPPEAAVRAALRRAWAPRFAWEPLPGAAPAGTHDAADPCPAVLLGNASGCAFRPDARRDPLFAGLDLDPATVAVHGCTFCLDGGTFAPEPVAETVAFVLRQLDALDAALPGVERLVLADDQPLPLLGPLVAALAERAAGTAPSAAAPGEPRRLLLKARVPDLLRGEAALRAAGRAAAGCGWTLELHCVGFESFCDDLLALFQKGFRAADGERAAHLLHDLADAPGLAAGRSRAHGFLLWTPWTTLEHLLATARAVRRVRFDALRDDWLETRLRLDPRQPLHALARAQGLLLEADGESSERRARCAAPRRPPPVPARPSAGHAGAAVDRAAAQGYAPAVPWRFRDPRAALTDRLLARLPADDRAPADRLERAALAVAVLTDAAVEEALVDPRAEAALAHRLVAAWRRGAWEPWHAAVAAAAGVPAAAAGVDPSVETLRAGLRRAAIVEGVAAAQAADLAALLAAGGLRVAVAPDAGAGEGCDLLLAHAPADLAALAAAHERLRRREDARQALVDSAELLGYPACCSAAFAALPDRRDDVANAIATLRRTTGPLDPRLNPFALRQLVPFHPCRYDCAAAAAFADRTAAALRARLGEETVAALRRAAATPVLAESVRARQALLGARWQGDELRWDGVAGPPLPLGEALRGADGLRETPDGLRLVRAGADAGPLPTQGAVLLAWGRAPHPSWVVRSAPGGAAGPTPAAGPAARVVAAALGAGHRLLRHERREGADVLLFDVAGTGVRIELVPVTPGQRAYAARGGTALAYRVGDGSAPAASLAVAPPAVRAFVEAAARAL
jgi:hypothetical protein